MVSKTIYRLMQVKSIAECSKGSILQYFRPSLSYQLSFRPLFCLFLSGRFTQVLLYFLGGFYRPVTYSPRVLEMTCIMSKKTIGSVLYFHAFVILTTLSQVFVVKDGDCIKHKEGEGKEKKKSTGTYYTIILVQLLFNKLNFDNDIVSYIKVQ